ncbi:MAG: PcfJ domain-containing protein [Dialister pneumosintes]
MDEFRVNKLFDCIRCFTTTTGEHTQYWSHMQPCMQFCVNCESAFSGVWGIKNNCGFGVFQGDVFTCPYCGYQHVKQHQHVYTILDSREQSSPIPYNIELKTVKRKDKLDLEVRAKCVVMQKNPADSYIVNKKEIIRFNLKSRKTFYILFCGQKILRITELSPFKSVGKDSIETIKDTALNYLNDDSCVHGSLRRELDKFIKYFRKELESSFRYKHHSTYIPTRVSYNLGAITEPLSNLIWRFSCPDAPNLKNFKAALSPVRANAIKRVMHLCVKGISYINAVKEVFDLPHWPSLNSVLIQYDVTQLFDLCHILSFYDIPEYGKEIAELNLDARRVRQKTDIVYLAKFFRILKSVKGEKWMHETIKDWCGGNRDVDDMAWMYGKLTERNKKALWAKKLRRRDLHDTIVSIYNKQKHENIVFEYDDKSLNLCGRLGGLQFLLPPDSDNLLELGKRMKNCVGSYKEIIATGKVDIVAAFNRDMRPLICIEIDNGEIVQAKLACNKSVGEKAELNQLIIDYAAKKNLTISTNDVRR